MKKLDIQITKATLKGYTVELEDGNPSVTATIALLTEGGKTITDYTVRTNAWNKDDKFDLPMTAIPPIVELAKILERVVTSHCRDAQLVLDAGEVPPVVKDIGDEPINLDDIPF